MEAKLIKNHHTDRFILLIAYLVRSSYERTGILECENNKKKLEKNILKYRKNVSFEVDFGEDASLWLGSDVALGVFEQLLMIPSCSVYWQILICLPPFAFTDF